MKIQDLLKERDAIEEKHDIAEAMLVRLFEGQADVPEWEEYDATSDVIALFDAGKEDEKFDPVKWAEEVPYDDEDQQAEAEAVQRAVCETANAMSEIFGRCEGKKLRNDNDPRAAVWDLFSEAEEAADVQEKKEAALRLIDVAIEMRRVLDKGLTKVKRDDREDAETMVLAWVSEE